MRDVLRGTLACRSVRTLARPARPGVSVSTKRIVICDAGGCFFNRTSAHRRKRPPSSHCTVGRCSPEGADLGSEEDHSGLPGWAEEWMRAQNRQAGKPRGTGLTGRNGNECCGSRRFLASPATGCTHHGHRKAGIYAELDLLLGRTCGRDSDPGSGKSERWRGGGGVIVMTHDASQNWIHRNHSHAPIAGHRLAQVGSGLPH